MRVRPRFAAVLAMFASVMACDTNPFDATQVPKITITPVVALPLVVIAYEPQGAALIRVYRGTVAGQGYGEDLWWSVAATSGNSLPNRIEYGTTVFAGGGIDVAAKPLALGQPYTVQVSRLDPKGKGDGFTNTGNRYVSTQTFTIASITPRP
jgi:hypothetical protein